MCIKSCKKSSFLMPKTALNPSAQEWRPPQHDQIPPVQSHVNFAPNSQPAATSPPPQTAVQVAAFAAPPPGKPTWQLPPQLPCYNYPLSFQGFIPYGPCTRPQHVYHYTTPFSFPSTGRFYEVVPPIFGGKKKFVGGPEEKIAEGGKPVVLKSRKSPPRMWRSVRYHGVDGNCRPTRRHEWRPRTSITPPPCNSVSNQMSSVPPRQRLSSFSKTTVMIKNIPNQLRRDFMLEFLDRYCDAYSLEYDFMYLPMDFRKEDNLGYAFVNFTTSVAALKFKEILQNYKWDTFKTEKGSLTSKKICEITWARIQGKEGLVKRFQNSNFACDKLDFLPVILDPPRNGSNTELAPPVVLGRLNQQNKIS